MADTETDRIEMSWVVDAKPKDVFDAWLSSEGHTEMTGGQADIDPRVGGLFTAWDGYIEGKTTKIDKAARKIIQSWRTSDFSSKTADSRIEVSFRALGGQTQVLLKHTRLKKGDGAKYTTGWYDFYLQPMVAFFADR